MAQHSRADALPWPVGVSKQDLVRSGGGVGMRPIQSASRRAPHKESALPRPHIGQPRGPAGRSHQRAGIWTALVTARSTERGPGGRQRELRRCRCVLAEHPMDGRRASDPALSPSSLRARRTPRMASGPGRARPAAACSRGTVTRRAGRGRLSRGCGRGRRRRRSPRAVVRRRPAAPSGAARRRERTSMRGPAAGR